MCLRTVVSGLLTNFFTPFLELTFCFFPCVYTAYKAFVKNPDTSFFLNEQDITAHVSVQKKASFLKMYYEKSSERIFPHLTIIVDVNAGVSMLHLFRNR